MSEVVKTSELVKEIKTNLKQKGCSTKDEVRVMKAMLNDSTYSVDVYTEAGKVDSYCPAKDAKAMIASVIASATKITKDEASVLAEDHEFSNAEAAAFVGISKEYVNTYLGTGRKLAFGGREKSSLALIAEDKEESVSRYPKQVGTDKDGKGIYENVEIKVPAFTRVKAQSACPAWVK